MAKASTFLDQTLRGATTPFMFAGLFSLASNLLYLAMPIYMNQVYARVLPSQSGATLFVLTFGILFVFMASGALDNFRDRVLINYGIEFDRKVSNEIFPALFDAAVRREGGGRAQALRDVDTVRTTMSGNIVAVLFDVPWIPLFILILFLIHPLIGMLTGVGGLMLLAVAWIQDRTTRPALNEAATGAIRSYGFTDAALRNSEVVRAMGMLPNLRRQWTELRGHAVERSATAVERSTLATNVIKLLRMFLQVVIIAAGAWLVIEREMHPGMLFANMMISARALAPIERVVAASQGLVNGLQSFDRIKALLGAYQPPPPATPLPRPSGRLTVEQVNFAMPGMERLLLKGVSFALEPGETMGVIGHSGAGKSTLTRLLVGVWRPLSGSVRLDAGDVFLWERTSFGRYVGYLPQDTELFSGSVRNNIARFRDDVDDEQVFAAAKLAGAHEMILRLPRGYDTELGEGGAVLSAGQRQRVGLSRALVGDPAFVVLDEPNSGLDQEGEAALLQALEGLKARGTTVVIVSHQPNIFRTADKILLMRDGRVDAFGPKEAVRAHIMKNTAPAAAPAPQREPDEPARAAQ
jgi:PrtD family type I secretion system ABC transporter